MTEGSTRVRAKLLGDHRAPEPGYDVLRTAPGTQTRVAETTFVPLELGPRTARLLTWTLRHRMALGTSASAALLTLAHAPLSVAPLGLIALVPWALATRHRGSLCAAWTGGVIGLLLGLAVSRWIPEALAAQGSRFIPSLLGWILTSLWATALPLGLLCMGIRALDRFSPSLQIPMAAALAFAIDLARTSHVAGVPWALLGHTQAPLLGIAQLAVAGGVPTLSALVVAVNLALASALAPDRTPARIGAALGGAAACLALALFGVLLAETLNALGFEGARSEPLRALLVRYRAPYEERFIPELQRTHLARLALTTERELRTRSDRPDLVVWPENTLVADLERDTEIRAALLEAVQHLGVDLVLGVLSEDTSSPSDEASAPGAEASRAYRSQALWVSPELGIVDRFEKTVGVPIVEATGTSWIERSLRSAFGIGASAPKLQAAREERPLRGRFEVAVALCYEAIFPEIVRARTTPETRAILNPSSDAWLPDPSLVSKEVTSYGSFRAIEARLPLLRIADAGQSLALDAFGRRLATLPSERSGAVFVEAPTAAPPRALERAGLILFALGIWAVVGTAAAAALRGATQPARST